MQLADLRPRPAGRRHRGRGRRGRLAGAGAGRPTRPRRPPAGAAPRGRRRRRLHLGARSPRTSRTRCWRGTGRSCWPRPAGTPTSAGSAAASSSTVPPPSWRPNLSLGAALFLRLAETAAGWYARAGSFEPSIVEWHRRGKADRPSGTARALARRIVGRRSRAGPTERRRLDGRPVLEVAGIRAGAAPGTHLVTFDGTGESIELRLAARDRSAYADGALAAARWLVARAPRARPASVRRRRRRPPRRRRPAPARLTASDPPRPNEGDAR